MTAKYKIKGGASCVWGISEKMTDVGTITDINWTDSDVSENCENQEGAVDGVVIYDGNKTLQATIIGKADATVPGKGTKLTVAEEDFLIQSVGQAKRHKGKWTVTISAIKHDNLVWAEEGGSQT